MAVARLNEELRVAKRERDAEVGTGASAAPAGSEMSARDEQAVRRMYEDLTGFIVSGVETVSYTHLTLPTILLV